MKKKSAFSLLELSVVMTVIALVISSFMALRSMHQDSEYKAFFKEVTYLRELVINFKAIYSYLPGDFPNAGKIFVNKLASCSNANLNPTGTTGCNGNGDGTWNTTAFECCYDEGYILWQHLQLADLIGAPSGGNNFYKGYKNAGSPNSDNNNLYESKVYPGILYLPLESWASHQNHPTTRGPKYRIGPFNAAYFTAASGMFTPAELAKIDVKFDDGHPKMGDIEGINHFDPTNSFAGFSSSDATMHCTTDENNSSSGTDRSAALTSATYRLTNSKKACMPQFIFKD